MTAKENISTRYAEAAIETDPDVPAVHIWRDFTAAPAQLVRAHTDPELFQRWVGPDSLTTRIEVWDCRTLGSYRYISERDGEQYAFRGTFPLVGENKIVQTFTFEGMPDVIVLETVTFEELGGGGTRLHAFSLCESFEARDAMLASGMESGVREGYAKLDRLLSEGEVGVDGA